MEKFKKGNIVMLASMPKDEITRQLLENTPIGSIGKIVRTEDDECPFVKFDNVECYVSQERLELVKKK